MKPLLNTTLLFLLVIGFSGCEPSDERLVTADALNVRSSPNGPVIDKVSEGQRVGVFEQVGDWSRIGRNKWVASEYLSAQIINESSQNPEPRPSQSPSARTVDSVYLSCDGARYAFFRLGFDEDARNSNRNKVPEEHVSELILSETYMMVWNGNPSDNTIEILVDSDDKFGIHPRSARENSSDNTVDFRFDGRTYNLDRESLALGWTNSKEYGEYVEKKRIRDRFNYEYKIQEVYWNVYSGDCRIIGETDYLAGIANILREVNETLQIRQDLQDKERERELKESLEQVQRRQI